MKRWILILISISLFTFITFNYVIKNLFPSQVVESNVSSQNNIENSKNNIEDFNKYLNDNKLSLDSIFSSDHSLVNKLPKDRIRTIIATGDIIPARSVNYLVIKYKDFNWPYLKTADKLKDADLTFSNIESPLLKDCPTSVEGMVFCGDKGNIDGLNYAGVDLVSLANNHAGNYGQKGVEETIQNLTEKGIKITGVGSPTIIDIKGMKFAFLGYNDVTTPQPGINNTDEEKIKKDIQEAKNKSDYVIVAFHWGVEYRSQPDDRQIYLGHYAIDNGADLIIGNHPHWIQALEIYKGKLITYAHGNFVFDQEWSQKTKEGVVGKYTFFDNRLIDVHYFPVEIMGYGQPFFADGDYKQQLLENMKQESIILSNNKNSN